ncbi:hypothetical protein DID77_01175 [Candidatus Marinamargulisbacteria bacterium SCGC AG-439-L15]|nr:hypothetical protein DID77_01175 [Candidatus Marinamargulisbacteria bacterium SCGC AG-439-L15]
MINIQYKTIVLTITLYLFSITHCYGFHYMTFNDVPEETFSIHSKIDEVLPPDKGNQEAARLSFGIQVMLKDISYKLDLYALPSSFYLTTHNFFWDPLSFKLPFFDSTVDLQLGILNVGVPEIDSLVGVSDEDITNIKNQIGLNDSYFKRVALTHRLQLFKNSPVYFYHSIFNTLENSEQFSSVYVLSLENNARKAYIEHYPDAKSYLLGVEVLLSNRVAIESILNPATKFLVPENEISVNNPLETRFAIGLKIINPLFSKPKRKTKPEMPKGFDMKTLTHIEKGLIAYYDLNYKEALKHYLKVAEHNPNFTLAYMRLGDIYFQLRLYEKSKQAWLKALNLEPDNPKIIAALKKLENLKLEKEAAPEFSD